MQRLQFISSFKFELDITFNTFECECVVETWPWLPPNTYTSWQFWTESPKWTNCLTWLLLPVTATMMWLNTSSQPYTYVAQTFPVVHSHKKKSHAGSGQHVGQMIRQTTMADSCVQYWAWKADRNTVVCLQFLLSAAYSLATGLWITLYLFFWNWEDLNCFRSKNSNFRDKTACSPLIINWHFKEICHLHLKSWRTNQT